MALTCAVVRAARADIVIGSLSGLYVCESQESHVFNEQLHGCKLDLPQAAHMLHRNTAHYICLSAINVFVFERHQTDLPAYNLCAAPAL